MRWVYVACTVTALAGCGFSASGGQSVDGPDSGVVGDDEPTPPTDPIARHCDTSDTALRMCIDFDDAATGPSAATDGSGKGHDATASNFTMTTRSSEHAAQLASTSRLHVAESPDLDISDAMTVSLWTNIAIADYPTGSAQRWLLDNNNQYFVYVRPGGAVRCGIGNTVVDTGVILPAGDWHHIACTYDGENFAVHIDGIRAGCRKLNGMQGGVGGGVGFPGGGPGGGNDHGIPTDGIDGLALGANLGAGNNYTDPLIGGLDNVQIYSRALSTSELCAAAGKTGCDAVSVGCL